MGIVASIISLVVGAATTIAQRKQAKKAERARREGQAIQTAGENIKNNLARRRAAKEKRVKRARIIANAEQFGAQGSSGAAGAQGALDSNFGSAVANQSSETQTALGLSAANQRVADAQSKSKQIAAFGGFLKSAVGFADENFSFG